MSFNHNLHPIDAPLTFERCVRSDCKATPTHRHTYDTLNPDTGQTTRRRETLCLIHAQLTAALHRLPLPELV